MEAYDGEGESQTPRPRGHSAAPRRRTGGIKFPITNGIKAARGAAKNPADIAAKYAAVLELMNQAKPKAPPGSKDELAYVIYKTKTLMEYHEFVAACHEANAVFHEFLLAKASGEKEDVVLKGLMAAQAGFGKADGILREIVKQMIPFARDPIESTERLWLFRFNKDAIGWMGALTKGMANVAAAHGKAAAPKQ